MSPAAGITIHHPDQKGGLMTRSHRFPYHLTALLLVSLGAGVASAQLNDTGQATCYDGSSLVPCTIANTGDTATYPRQDGRLGRDAAATAGVLPKTGGGAAGFDFTPLTADGSEIALTGNPPVPSQAPACIRDNHTNRIWEVKTDDGGLRDKDWTYTWYDGSSGSPGVTTTCNNTLGGTTPCNTHTYAAAVNAADLCGYSSGWRTPTRRELLSIVHNGTFNPTIDTSYFPNTTSGWYWSADTYAPTPAEAWHVVFNTGRTNTNNKGNDINVRLVRSEPPVP